MWLLEFARSQIIDAMIIAVDIAPNYNVNIRETGIKTGQFKDANTSRQTYQSLLVGIMSSPAPESDYLSDRRKQG